MSGISSVTKGGAPLNKSEIIEIIDAQIQVDRIEEFKRREKIPGVIYDAADAVLSIADAFGRNNYNSIGKLVSLSKDNLSLADLSEIYKKFTTIPDVDPARSATCADIAACMAEKIGMEVGVPRVKVSGFDGDSLSCTLLSNEVAPTGVVSDLLNAVSRASRSSVSSLRNKTNSQREATLTTPLAGADALGQQERNTRLENLQRSGTISNISTGTDGNIVVRIILPNSLSTVAESNVTVNPLTTPSTAVQPTFTFTPSNGSQSSSQSNRI